MLSLRPILRIVALSSLCIGYTPLTAASSALEVPDFRLETTYSGGKLKVEAYPPDNHHINTKAPCELVEMRPGKKGKRPGGNHKPAAASAQKLIFDLPPKASSPGKEFEAVIFLCDNDNTYCIQKRSAFLWDGKATAKTESSMDIKNQKLGEEIDSKKKVQKDKFGFFMNGPEEAFERAKKEIKPVLIDFYGIWCPPCNQLDEETYNTKLFKEASKKYILLKIDSDAPSSWALKSKYKVGGYPTLIAASASGDEIDRVTGFRPARELTEWMGRSLEVEQLDFGGLHAKARLGDAVAAEKLGMLYASRKETTKALEFLEVIKTPNEQVREAIAGLKLERAEESETNSSTLHAQIDSFVREFPTSSRTLLRLAVWVELTAKTAPPEALKPTTEKALALLETFQKNKATIEKWGYSTEDLLEFKAQVHEAAGNAELAKTTYQKAADAAKSRIARSSKLSLARGPHMTWAYLLKRAGKPEEALKIYRRFQKLYPKDFTFYYSEATTLRELGKMAEAEEKALKAYEFSYGDNRLRAVELLTGLQRALGKSREALDLARTTLKEIPDPSSFEVRTKRYLANLKRVEEELSQAETLKATAN